MAKTKIPFDISPGAGWVIVKDNAPKGKSASAAAFPKSLKKKGALSGVNGNGKVIKLKHTMRCEGYADIVVNFSVLRRFSNSDDPKIGKYFWFESFSVFAASVDPYIGYTINAKLLSPGFRPAWKGDIFAPELFLQLQWEAVSLLGNKYKPKKVSDFAFSSAKATGRCSFDPK